MLRMVLTGLEHLEIAPLLPMTPDVSKGQVLARVLCCAICRTDAKMWENLCEKMKITGFHTDGGFAHQVILPRASLIPLPEGVNIHVACFAEPIGCVINAFERLTVKQGDRVLIYGAGTMGLVTALYAKSLGLIPLIIEKHENKIRRTSAFLEETAIACVKETLENEFDIVINACPDPIALCQAITKVDNKGLEHKTKVIERALTFHRPNPANGFEILEKIGGFEIAGIVGAILAAASKGCAVVLDGVISTAAGLVAHTINPWIQGYLISGHKSVEPAQKAALTHMDLTPVIDFNMRLGEGTGAAMAMDTIDAACKIMTQMASFDEAKISRTAVFPRIPISTP